MSIDRYLTLLHPNTSQMITSSNQTAVIICCIWFVASVFMGPLLYLIIVEEVNLPNLQPLMFCIEDWPQPRDRYAYGLFLLFVVFIVPATTIGICYAHIGCLLCSTDIQSQQPDSSPRQIFTRQRAARVIVALVLVFVVCWLPYTVMSAVLDLSGKVDSVSALPFVLWLGHAHSAINPAMYWTLNRRFRLSVRRILKRAKISSCSTVRRTSVSNFV